MATERESSIFESASRESIETLASKLMDAAKFLDKPFSKKGRRHAEIVRLASQILAELASCKIQQTR